MKLLFQCVICTLFCTVGAYEYIDSLLRQIVLGNLGVKNGQKFIYSMPFLKRRRSGALRMKVTRYRKEFDAYAAVRRGVLIVLALVQIVQIVLIALGRENIAELLLFVSVGAFMIPTGVLSLHAREWHHRTRYTRNPPTKEERGRST